MNKTAAVGAALLVVMGAFVAGRYTRKLRPSSPMPAGLTVPQDAVLDSGRELRVFVERSSGVFEPRQAQFRPRRGHD